MALSRGDLLQSREAGENQNSRRTRWKKSYRRSQRRGSSTQTLARIPTVCNIPGAMRSFMARPKWCLLDYAEIMSR